MIYRSLTWSDRINPTLCLVSLFRAIPFIVAGLLPRLLQPPVSHPSNHLLPLVFE